MSAPRPGPDREPAREREPVRATSSSLTPLVLAIAGAALLLHQLRIILLPFVIAAVIAYVCTPLIDRVKARTHLPRWLLAACVLAVLLGVTALVAFLALPPLMRQVQSVVGDLHGAVSDFMRALLGTHSVRLFGSSLDVSHLADLLVSALQHEMTGGRVLSLVGFGVAATFGFMLAWVLLGYFLIDAHAIGAGLLRLVPPSGRARAEQVWRELDPSLRRYFIGVAVVVAYATAAASLGLGLVLGLKHAFLLALLTGVLELVPMIGPAAAAVIAGLVAVQQAATPWAIWAYVGYAAVLRLSIDQLVGPLVLGNAARVHPVVVIFGLLAGGVLFGIVGMILAVPIALLVKVSLAVRYRDAR